MLKGSKNWRAKGFLFINIHLLKSVKNEEQKSILAIQQANMIQLVTHLMAKSKHVELLNNKHKTNSFFLCKKHFKTWKK